MQPKAKVLVTLNIPLDHLIPELTRSAEVVLAADPSRAMSRQEAMGSAGDAVAVINHGELKIDGAFLEAAPALRIVSNVAIGTDNFDKAAMAARGVWATNAPDAFTEATADATMGLLLAVARKITEGDRYVRSCSWERDGIQPRRWEGALLAGKVLGLVGFGAIGKAVARRAEAFGMRVIYHRRTPDFDARSRPLEVLLSEADIVSLHTPLTDETHHLMNRERFALMKGGAFFVNMARGKVVDEFALVDALRAGAIAGAGLDVFENEPAVHPDLLTMENVALCPHVGGSTVESRKHARLLASENVLRVLQGERPRTPVNEPCPGSG